MGSTFKSSVDSTTSFLSRSSIVVCDVADELGAGGVGWARTFDTTQEKERKSAVALHSPPPRLTRCSTHHNPLQLNDSKGESECVRKKRREEREREKCSSQIKFPLNSNPISNSFPRAVIGLGPGAIGPGQK